MENFHQFIGQNKIITNLLTQIKMDELGHAHMFVAPDGQGKSTLASIFAATILCDHPDLSKGPCGTCHSCEKNQKQIHPDFILIGDGEKNLKIEEIRNLKQTINYKPTDSHRKVYLIKNVENMTRESANSILKILEEPPSYVVFILTVSDFERMLPTVISRCQVYHFTPLTEQEIRVALEQATGANGEQLEAAVSLSGGMIGRGISLLLDGDYGEMISKVRSLSEQINEISLPEMLNWAEDIDKSGEAKEFLELLNILFRKKFISNSNEINRQQLTDIMEIVVETKGQLLTNVNQLLALEGMMVKIKEVAENGRE